MEKIDFPIVSIEIEAETIDEARERIRSQVPDGLRVLSENIISDGRSRIVKAESITAEDAFLEAQAEIPTNAEILEREVITPARQMEIAVEAFDEQTARSNARTEAGKQFGASTHVVANIGLMAKGGTGFLGVSKKPNRYKATIDVLAMVQISYKTKAKISASVGRAIEDIVKERWFLGAIEELASIYRQNPDGFSNPTFFKVKDKWVPEKGFGDPAARARLQEIGRLFESHGGFNLMKAAHAVFSRNCEVLGAARNLEIVWNGIGRWRG